MIVRRLSSGTARLGRIGLVAGVLVLCASASPAAQCTGDCDQGGSVTVDEVLQGVNIALGNAPLGDCVRFDANADNAVTVEEVLAAVSNALNGCTGDAPTESPTATTTGTPTATPLPTTPTPSGTPSEASSVPVTAPELFAWLQAGNFRDWPAESGMHASPIHGTVRVFVNPLLFDSLQSGRSEHPAGAAAVKELYSRGAVVGWSVMVKVQDDSAAGAGWYWYEGFGPSPGYSGRGLSVCTGCHSLGRDYFRSQFPLQ